MLNNISILVEIVNTCGAAAVKFPICIERIFCNRYDGVSAGYYLYFGYFMVFNVYCLSEMPQEIARVRFTKAIRVICNRVSVFSLLRKNDRDTHRI